MTLTVERLTLERIDVSDRTTWLTVALTASGGLVGFGECSDGGSVEGFAAEMSQLDALVVGGDLTDIHEIQRRLSAHCHRAPAGPPRFLRRTVAGAVISAACDVLAQKDDLPLWKWLGGKNRQSVPLYANINRSAGQRRPQDFANVAAAAVADGFTAVKLAPFDGPVHPNSSVVATGLANTAAVREAVGDRVTVLVDVHQRLSWPDLESVAAPLEQLGIGWLEDAVEVSDLAGLDRLSGITSLALAGGERIVDPDTLERVARSGRLNYLLLDPKYIGGPLQLRALLGRIDGVHITFHNPTGPIATAMCAQLSTLHQEFSLLEFAYGEKVDRNGLITGTELIADGRLAMPKGAGCGVGLRGHSKRASP